MATYLSHILQNKTLTKKGILIDCSEIRLEQNGGERRTWRLSGTLTVDFRGGISARLVSFGDDRPVLSPFHRIIEGGKVRSGEIFPESHYFSLTAVDVNGIEWKNPSVEVAERPADNCTIIEMHCNWIRGEYGAPDTRNHIRMLFLEQLDFPLNDIRQTEEKGAGRSSLRSEFIGSKGDTTKVSIRYEKADADDSFNILWASAKEGTQLRESFASKIIEAIRFVTATKASFCVSETVSGEVAVLELAKAPTPAKGLFPPPLHNLHPRHARDFFKLFDAFLEHALGSSTDETFSPLALKFYPLYGLNDVSLESIALLVSVTVEAVVKEQFPELGMPEEQVLQDVTTINDAIEKLDVAQRTKDRAKGSLGGMKSSRADDKLNSLRDRNILSKEEIAAWKSLRNASAHGSLHARPNELQKLLDNVYKAATLLNKLALLAIRYAGAYTDHSIRGWPEKEFPPQIDVQLKALHDSAKAGELDSSGASAATPLVTEAKQEAAEQPAATARVTERGQTDIAPEADAPALQSATSPPKDGDTVKQEAAEQPAPTAPVTATEQTDIATEADVPELRSATVPAKDGGTVK